MSDLIERLRAATGPNRELDGEIWTSLLWTKENTDPIFWALLDEGKWRDALSSVQYNWQAKDDWVPSYTASLDAALALVRRVLKCGPITVTEAGTAMAYLEDTDPCGWTIQEFGNTPPLAVLTGLLTALAVKDTPK